MMKFKSWKEQYKFVLNYATCSCFDCKFGGEIEDSDKESDYVRKFCSKFLSMVDFQFQFPLCAEWESDDGKVLKDYEGASIFKLDDDFLNELDTNHEWTYEELVERIKEHEEVKE